MMHTKLKKISQNETGRLATNVLQRDRHNLLALRYKCIGN